MSTIIDFKKSPALSIGVELEVQLIDRDTLDLTPKSMMILKEMAGDPRIQPELLQSMLEVTSLPRSNVREIKEDLKSALNDVYKICNQHGIEIACAGTHPTAKYLERKLYPSERFQELIDRNQFLARRLMIFGIHVHIGVESGEMCIALMNELLYELPIFLALSASSPFWEGTDTGLASSRITFFESIPTGGHPCRVEDWNDFEQLIGKLTRSKAITSLKDIWWDIRPSPKYGTIEIRVCDGMPTLEENMAIAALIHAVATRIYSRVLKGERRPILPDWQIRENKWRASRHGVEADLIVSPDGTNNTFRNILNDIISDLDSIVEKLGYQKYMQMILQSVNGYCSYERQRKVFSETNDMKQVTRLLVNEMSASLHV